MIKPKMYFLSLLIFLPFVAAGAELQFASPFTSGMVLQRDAPINIHGSATAGETVTVTLGLETQSAIVADDGQWTVRLNAMPAGGPHAMMANVGDSRIRIDDLLIGDVWVFSGQSNMQMGLAEVAGGREAIAAASVQLPVRLLSVPKAAAESPQGDLNAQWKRCSPESLRKFSAVAWFFSEHLRRNPGRARIPLGLIDSSFGGTAIEGWTPAGTLPEIPSDRVSGSMFGIPPANLFNSMIAPLLPYRIKGVAWYQGEANAGAPEVYSSLLQNMIRQWRAQWKQPDLPFLIVQLPAFEGRMGGLDFGWLREAQSDACRKTKNTWLAVTYDTTDGFDLHPREKEAIGRRLSLLAEREVYGENVLAQSPQFESMQITGDRVIVTFDQTVTVPEGELIRGFALAGADGDFRFADATIEDSRVELTVEDIATPEFVRYAWGAMPEANVFNHAGLPAVPFRTDDIKPQTLAFQPLPTVYRIETPDYLLETGRGGSITSLVVDGLQFLSNEPGGGTTVPGFFGPRNLALTTLIGPKHLALSDGGATLEIAAQENTMVWTFTNSGDDPIELHIALAPQVGISADGSSAELSRGDTQLLVDGIERVERGSKLVARAAAKASTQIHWTIPIK